MLFRSYSDLCILILGVDCYCCTWSHSIVRLHAQAHTFFFSLSVGLLWTRDQPIANTSTWQHTTFTWDRNPCAQRDTNPQPQQASGRSPRPRGHHDRPRSWYSRKMKRTEFKYHTSTFRKGLWKIKETISREGLRADTSARPCYKNWYKGTDVWREPAALIFIVEEWA